MRKTLNIALAAWLIPAIFGQAPAAALQDGVFTLKHTATVQEFQEIANTIRTVVEIRDLTTDNQQRSMAVRGTAEQLAVADWLVKQLDQPVDLPRAGTDAPEYKGVTGDDGRGHAVPNGDVVQVFYLSHAPTVQDFQEIANATRTVTETRRVFTYNDGRAVVVRGTPEQVAMVEWVLRALDQPPPARVPSGASTPDYSVSRDDLIRVFHVTNAKSVQDFQEIANTMRTMAEIRRVFTYNAGRTVVVRGTADELGMADWLLRQLDKPSPQGQQSEEFRVPGAADDVMRVFYLPPAQTVQAFQQSAAQIRTKLEIRRVFVYGALRAMSVRGTESQLALAQHMVEEIGQ